MNLRKGQPVRVLNPDRPEHAKGFVRSLPEDDRGGWFVFVEHSCDCWHHGHIQRHVRGYMENEVAV